MPRWCASSLRRLRGRHQEFPDDIFAPSSWHSTSRLIDYIALKRRLDTFIADVTNAFFHVDESVEFHAYPPKEF